MKRALLLGPAVAVIVLLLLVPLSYLADISFRENIPGRVIFAADRSIQNYILALTDTFYLSVLGQTIFMSAAATVVSVVLGFPLAYFLWRAPRSAKGLLTLLIVAPLLISIVVRAYGWMVILGDQGLLNQALISLGLIDRPIKIMFTSSAMFIGLVHVQFPFMVLSILTGLERIDAQLISAAETLGASRLRAVVEVVMPLAIPGIVTGMMLVFTLCMTAFVTPILLGGSSGKMMTTLIYSQFNTAFNWPLGSTLAIVLSIVSLLVVSVFLTLIRRIPLVRRAESVGKQ